MEAPVPSRRFTLIGSSRRCLSNRTVVVAGRQGRRCSSSMRRKWSNAAHRAIRRAVAAPGGSTPARRAAHDRRGRRRTASPAVTLRAPAVRMVGRGPSIALDPLRAHTGWSRHQSRHLIVDFHEDAVEIAERPHERHAIGTRAEVDPYRMRPVVGVDLNARFRIEQPDHVVHEPPAWCPRPWLDQGASRSLSRQWLYRWSVPGRRAPPASSQVSARLGRDRRGRVADRSAGGTPGAQG